MTEDTRRNKLELKNNFYLELIHKYNGDFEAMLSPDEHAIWNIFPDFHKGFFTYFKGQEWEIISSLRLFSDETIVGKINGYGIKKSEQAKLSLETYVKHRSQNKTTLSLLELKELLYPLRSFDGVLLQQEIAESLFYSTSDPDIASLRDSQEWQQYGVKLQPVPLTWLELQENEYLRRCALVWRSYLPVAKTVIDMPSYFVDCGGKYAELFRDADQAYRESFSKHPTAVALFDNLSTLCPHLVKGIDGEAGRRETRKLIFVGSDYLAWKSFLKAFKRYFPALSG